MSDQYNTRNCIICGKVQLMCMSENVICHACEETSVPADEIMKLRRQLKASAELLKALEKITEIMNKDMPYIAQGTTAEKVMLTARAAIQKSQRIVTPAEPAE
jgi:hypothetical protein